MYEPVIFASNPAADWALKIALILAGTCFAVRHVLTRRTWLAPLGFAVLTAILAAPLFFSIDLWSEVASAKPFLLAAILAFFILSPFLEWLDEKRIEAYGQKMFRRSAHEIQLAFQALAREKIGALVAIEREDTLHPLAKKGIPVNGDITKEVLATLFTPYTPTHDGGLIITDRKIASCGCVFPLSTNEHLAKDMGTRHRAALGLSEQTDALVLVVSEESGEIAVASHGKLEHNLAPERLEKKILAELGQTHHKSKLRLAFLSQKRLRVNHRGALSSTSLARRILVLTGAAFFAALFASFAPKELALDFRERWDWIFAVPLLASLALLVRFVSGPKTAFHPEARQIERTLSFLGIPLLKRAFLYEKLKGLTVFASKRWKNLYELRLFKSRFTSWLILESKNLQKLEEAKLALDPPRPPTNFGSPPTPHAA